MVSALISRVVILVFGTLYPAYSSYKAVKTKNVKEYVKWMMYWIVFALFTSVETFADVLVSWFPFYYELKIVFVIWLLSPATKGSSVLYRKFVHPELMKREQEIDQTLEKVKSQGYSALVNVGQQGLNLAVQGAVTGQNRMMDHLMKKSFSLGDLSRQADSAPVSYKPSTERIVEDRDEPDFMRQEMREPPPSRFTTAEVQGGTASVPESDLTASSSRTGGYNLRSHEYHGEGSSSSSSQHYNHQETIESNSNDIIAVSPQPLQSAAGRPARSRTASAGRTRSRTRSAGRKRNLPRKHALTKSKSDISKGIQ